MKRWKMIHKIKDLKNNGLSQRAVAKELRISRKTVQKYWDKGEEEICKSIDKSKKRSKEVDKYREYIEHMLEKYPELSASKIKRKLEEKGIKVKVKIRALRYYISPIKKKFQEKEHRHYVPVIDIVPGAQAQVDMGESREVIIGGEKVRVYFAVMVMSYSRKMYCHWSLKAYNTDKFIEFHNLAFSYFEGVPEELVYDQTKLVVIEERYREVYFNEKFYQYATMVGFTPWICEGYNPESKGRVEAGVKYVKRDFLYGEEFESFNELGEKSWKWLNEIANIRVHGATGKRPCDVFVEENPYLKSYKEVIIKDEVAAIYRRVDKTGLISYKGNKYSVPEKYQREEVRIEEVEEGSLVIFDLGGREVARHIVCQEKCQMIINNNHYRDQSKTIEEREKLVKEIIPETIADNICKILKKNNPKIYKDQLVGLYRVCDNYPLSVIIEVLDYLQNREQGLRVTLIEEFIKARMSALVVDGHNQVRRLKLNKYKFLDYPGIKQHSLNIYKKIGGVSL